MTTNRHPGALTFEKARTVTALLTTAAIVLVLVACLIALAGPWIIGVIAAGGIAGALMSARA